MKDKEWIKETKLKTEEEVWEFISRPENRNIYWVWRPEGAEFGALYIVESKSMKEFEYSVKQDGKVVKNA